MMKLDLQLKKLESIVESLESDTVDLDTAVDQYAQAVGLAGELVKSLRQAEKKLLLLKQEGDAILTTEIV